MNISSIRTVSNELNLGMGRACFVIFTVYIVNWHNVIIFAFITPLKGFFFDNSFVYVTLFPIIVV